MNWERAFWAWLHALAMLAILVGAVACWFFPYLTFIQIPAVSWVVWFHLTHDYCPLTKKEHEAMQKHGQKPYKGGFYAHYLFNNILGVQVKGNFVRHFLTATKIIPGFLPLLYPLIKALV